MKTKHQILILILILMLFSLINNYSAGFIMLAYKNYFIKVLMWYLIGFFAIWLMTKVNLNLLFKYSFYLYILGNVALLMTLLIGSNINGSTSWLIIGPISIQPSEFVKIFLILYLCYFTHKYKFNDFKYIILTLIIIAIPAALTFLQPDTGALIPYLIIYVTFLINKKLNKWWYIGAGMTVITVAVAFFTIYYGYHDLFIKLFGTAFFYRLDRINDFLTGSGYQINKALSAIGSAGLFGHGIRNIPEYFPEAPTDFAFALLINNFGFIGIVLFLLVYSLLIFKLINLINKKNRWLTLPIVLIILIQFSINVLMNVGLFPIIGITLPFVSYGGSSLLSYLILIGLAINLEHIKKYQ